jgi:GNAT superfamily N-acetyltransferase
VARREPRHHGLVPTVRLATLDDLDAIQRLYVQLHPDAEPDDALPDARPNAHPGGRAVLERILAADGLDLLVLEQDGEVVGTTYLNVIPNLTQGGRPYAWVENVVIDERLRGEGLGRQLMAATLERAWAAGCYKVSLTTGRSDPAVHAFYRSCGFDASMKTAYVVRR